MLHREATIRPNLWYNVIRCGCGTGNVDIANVQGGILERITFDPAVMGGKPCIRGMRVTVGMIVGLVAARHSREEIIKLYPYLEDEDITQALTYAAWRAEELDIPLASA